MNICLSKKYSLQINNNTSSQKVYVLAIKILSEAIRETGGPSQFISMYHDSPLFYSFISPVVWCI